MSDKVTTTIYIYTLMLSNNHGLLGDYYLIQILSKGEHLMKKCDHTDALGC